MPKKSLPTIVDRATNRDNVMRKFKWQYIVWNMPKKSLPTIVDRAVWEKETTGRAGIRWDSVVVKVRKNIGGNQGATMSVEKFGRYTAEVE